MNCLTCKTWRMKGAPLIRHGFGLCMGKTGSNTVPGHSCPQHQPAPPATIAARRAWFLKPAKATYTAGEATT